ncbi:TPA: XRE family transcriptional regulator [Candidatus Uhrbacteria bacterium]|nr:XRE family transcriptional regulator [Candidatus Uhrbacteria bacterium]
MNKAPVNIKLRDLRIKKGLTQYKLARILGFKHNTAISRYETGRKRPNLETAQRIALALGVRVEEVFLP